MNGDTSSSERRLISDLTAVGHEQGLAHTLTIETGRAGVIATKGWHDFAGQRVAVGMQSI
jgi:hypothetical protein